ncbi:MAG: helix-turn-helix transcriptional regulator [Saprospiraceae bacterium]|nr:helix-turn-helix transcriptional regulator [Saprospiraceae bacterium]
MANILAIMNPYSIQKTPNGVLLETAARHKVLRKKSGFTQAELADRAGISLGSLKRFEQTGQISFESLLRLAQLLERLDDFEDVFKIDMELEAAERLFSDKTRRS